MPMAELPEISKITKQMNSKLTGKEILEITLLQNKSANVSGKNFCKRCKCAKILSVKNKGKWFWISLDNKENILISLGMGGDLLYFKDSKIKSEKYQVRVNFADNTGFTLRFWWFGKFILCSDKELSSEPNTKDIGIDPYDKRFTIEYFKEILKGKKTQIKAFLLNQKNISAIGNMYMHDILFKAKLHPKKKIQDMKEKDILALYDSINNIFEFSQKKGASWYEFDFLGKKGNYCREDFLVGYKEKKPCPICSSEIQFIKTGSTSSYICPKCQKI